MDDNALQSIYHAVVIANLTYTSSVWWAFTSAADRQWLDAFIHRSGRGRFVSPDLSKFADLCQSADEKLFSDVTTNSDHVNVSCFASFVAGLTVIWPETAGAQIWTYGSHRPPSWVFIQRPGHALF